MDIIEEWLCNFLNLLQIRTVLLFKDKKIDKKTTDEILIRSLLDYQFR